MNKHNSPTSESPKWGSTAKLIIGLSYVAIITGLLVYSRSFIGPLLLSFILIYLLHPLAHQVHRLTHLSWRMSVNLIFLVLIILLITTMTLTGLAIIQQIQNLIQVVNNFITTDLPNLVTNLSTHVYTIGPFELNLAKYDIVSLTNTLLSNVQPMLGRVGGLVSSFATSAASTLGWTFFVIIIAYFVLSDANRITGDFINIDIPGYTSDVRRLSHELTSTWNAFLRNQLVIFILIVILYMIILTILGVRYSLAIALLAGLARFVPYLGPVTTYTITALVTFFQGGNYYGLQPWQYTLMVIVTLILVDQVFDNLVTPRLVSQSLGVHPAAVLVAAFIATNLIGIIGLVLAAPVLATLNLLARYTFRKMLDQDPWPPTPTHLSITPETSILRILKRARHWIRQRMPGK